MAGMLMHAKLIIAVFVGGLAPGATALAEETLESVEKALTKRWENVESYTAKVTMKGLLEYGGRSNETTGSGDFELLNSGGVTRYRITVDSKTVSPTFDGSQVQTEETVQSVGDGHTLYVMKDQRALGSGARFAGRLPITSMPRMDMPSVVDVTKVFKTLRDRVKLDLLAVTPPDLPPVYVVELTPRDETKSLAKMTVFFAKDSGVVLRTISSGRTAEWTMELNYEDIDLSAKPHESRFVFRAPKDTGIMDIPE
jgi:outer membrane lipoprotein-sorting protein